MKVPLHSTGAASGPPPQRGCRVGDPGLAALLVVQIRPGILTPRALPARRITGLGAARHFHHGLLESLQMDRIGALSVGPTAEQERYEFLDVLRGFALVGIVLANMISLSLYLYLPESAKAGMSTASIDGVLDFIELALIESKFYTIFSVLFGIGFSILMTRTESKRDGLSAILSAARVLSLLDRRRSRGVLLA